MQRVPPLVELGSRVHAQVQALQARRVLPSVIHNELEGSLIHPHRRHLLVRHGLTVDHDDRPRWRASISVRRAVVPGRGEQLHFGRLVKC
eukprot:scaffold59778_cov60-Phaeocystis_antarctica.AAC.2